MKRTPLLVVVLVIAGTILNLAVAWGFAAWRTPTNGVPVLNITQLADGDCDVVTRLRHIGMTRINRARLVDFDANEPVGNLVRVQWRVTGNEYSEVQSGWPMRAFGCRNYAEIELRTASLSTSTSKSGFNPIIGGIVLSPFKVGSPAMSWRALPYEPMWLGAIVNTLFYALVVWLLVFARGWVRRTMRARRGQCEACGYPIGESAVCTECGAKVRRDQGRAIPG